MRNKTSESRQVLSDREDFNNDQKRILDLLAQGLSHEFPNPQRVGCPDPTILRGIAFHKLRLAEVEQWLNHLSSCSPCFQEFTEMRKEAVSQRRRIQVWLVVGAALILAGGGWLWMRARHSLPPSNVAVLDLRGLSISRGEGQPQIDQRPLEIQRSSKHLVMEVPIGSEEGTYDLALLSEAGAQILDATGTAKLEDHNVTLRADLDLSGVRPGVYVLALR